MGTVFEREIREQPEVLARQLERGRAGVEAVAEKIRAADPAFVVLAARGSSDNAARYAQYLLGINDGLTVALAAPSILTVYGARPSFGDALVVGISQSGESPDIVTVLEEAKRQGAVTVAITNAPTSPLARAADGCITLQAGEEKAVAASKTYTAQLHAVAMLSAALSGDEARWAELEALPDRVAGAIDLSADVRPEAARFRYARRFVVIGRGLSYASAHEIALKLEETSYVLAQPYSSADFRHGPIAMVDRELPIVLIAPTDRASGDVVDLIDALVAREAELVVISDREDVLARARVPLRLPAGVPEWLSPIVSVVPGQLWALALALGAGLDPDAPRGLHKVTRTR